MLSDEEKKAIDFFEKSFLKKIPPYWYDDTISNIEEKIKTILNLIEKLSKEIEELKQEKEYLNCIIESDEDNYINKDKIKAKIEWLDKEGYFEFLSNRDILKCHNILVSLLEKE